MIALFVNKSMAGKQIPSIGEIYPEFREECDQAALNKFKQDLLNFAKMHNKGEK